MADTTVRIDGNTLRLPGGVAVGFPRRGGRAAV